MNKEDIQRVTSAVRVWADFQPPDKPVLFLAGKSYTAKQLAEEIEQQTPIGILQLNVFEHAVKNGEDLNELLAELLSAAH